MKEKKPYLKLTRSQKNRRVRRLIQDSRKNLPTLPQVNEEPSEKELYSSEEEGAIKDVTNVVHVQNVERCSTTRDEGTSKHLKETCTGQQSTEQAGVVPDLVGCGVDDCEMRDISRCQDAVPRGEVLCNAESDCDSSNHEQLSFQERLGRWADHSISEHKVNELLSILKDEGHKVPATAKTLRKTGRMKTPIRKCAPGEYLHYGLQKALEEQIVKYNLQNTSVIEFDINIDGLKLSDRSKRTLWPILGRVVGVGKNTQPFVIGVYHGFAKPRSAKTYLKQFIREYKKLKSSGFVFKGKRYTCSLKCAICDAPARSFVKCTAQHNGFYGCDKCHAKGKKIGGRLCFLKLNAKKRTNIGFRTRKQKGHHLPRKRSVFEWLKSLDMIRAFPLDPMHLVYLGDVKYLLNLISEFNNRPDSDINVDFKAFGAALEEVEKWIPEEFSKKRVKDFGELGKWKATHGRFFLLYASIPLAHQFLPKRYAEHISKLTCAIRILSDSDQYVINNAYADSLLREFIRDYKILYGEEYLVYNLHNLIHLAEEALQNGTLDSFSAFPFENFMRILKSFVRKPEGPLQQIHHCLKHRADFLRPEPVTAYPIETGRKLLNLPLGCSDGFSKIIFKDFQLSTSPPNNVCILDDRTVVMIDFFGYKDGKRVIIGKRVMQKKDVPLYPGPSSSQFMISIVSKPSLLYEAWPVTSIYRKAVTIVSNNTCYIIPLLHNELYHR
ncbi:hypothetical protein QAD02_022957 [Eretmocerus hayati]|uniref:Uncharacterized protein n=1 Tax=Eretmocerus hayati TaxID=131215 RepID=A0ACC2PW37_9HYME|nr:hypothetical protein QAD02_022957 [Eretmocerus hayati]